MTAVLRRHAGRSPDEGSKLIHLGKILVDLQRTLAAQQASELRGKQGAEDSHLAAACEGALASADKLELQLWDASFSRGRLIEVFFDKQKVAIKVSAGMTFSELTNKVVRYWSVEGGSWSISDQHGVQFLDTMTVQNGLRLCPSGTSLHLYRSISVGSQKPAQVDTTAADVEMGVAQIGETCSPTSVVFRKGQVEGAVAIHNLAQADEVGEMAAEVERAAASKAYNGVSPA